LFEGDYYFYSKLSIFLSYLWKIPIPWIYF